MLVKPGIHVTFIKTKPSLTCIVYGKITSFGVAQVIPHYPKLSDMATRLSLGSLIIILHTQTDN